MPYQTYTKAKVPVKIWVKDLEEVEPSALEQIHKTADLPWVEGVSVMADCHAGKGCTIGSVIVSRAAVSPAVVGVDIGCVDADTEFLSPDGWVRIADYSGQDVLSYEPSTGTAEFVEPLAYIKKPCAEMWRIKTKYGVDLKVDDGHRHLVYRYTSAYDFATYEIWTTAQIVEAHSRLQNGFRHRFNTAFRLVGGQGLPFTDIQLRILVMVCADGHFSERSVNSPRCILSCKKQRKVERAKQLLNAAHIPFKQSISGDMTRLSFYAPYRTKSLSSFWKASPSQLAVISDELFYWDGNSASKTYYTRDKASADFAQFALSAVGFRSTMRADQREDGTDYRVFALENTKVGINGGPKTEITQEKTEDGYKYCFTVPSGFFVIRRGGNVIITGNCGMSAIKTPYRSADLHDLPKLRASIERSIPVGHDSNKTVTQRMGAFLNSLGPYSELANPLIERAALQLGSLGGGNHFIEVCVATDDYVWIMLHSGSRHIGKVLAEKHIASAKGLMGDLVKRYGQSFDPDLAALAMGTPEYNAYIFDLLWCQRYAAMNRNEMMLRVLKDFSYHMHSQDIGPELMTLQRINCHHNYIEYQEDDLGAKLVTRKGAVSAKSGELGIIPGSMGTKSYIVRGRGNPDSNCSCSHGAGRRMSRGAAKRAFTEEDVIAQTAGVECRKDLAIADELPGAYKDLDEVMSNQADLVEIVAELKAVLCVKG